MHTNEILNRSIPLLGALSLALALNGCSFVSTNPEGPSNNLKKVEHYKIQKAHVANRPTTNAMESAVVSTEVREAVRDDRPNLYIVKKGDTLWDISGQFLSKPWLWPQIWNVNPQIKNPHLIYPGDEVALRYVNGQPVLVVTRDGMPINASDVRNMATPKGGDMHLSPTIRESSLASSIASISGDVIQQFLVYPRVVDEETLENAPYVLGNYEGRLTSATGHQIYIRGRINKDQTNYGIFRESSALVDPDTGEKLGYEITHVADAKLMQLGDPSTMIITGNRMETLAGDNVMSQNQNYVVHSYIPQVPSIEGEGKIVSLFDAISRSGRNQVVVINLGDREGIEIGDVLAIEHRGGIILDKFSKKTHDYINIPNTRIGVMMIFRTFEKVSYGLIMESSRPISKLDSVTGI